jgi:hypothetical protein
VLTDVIAGDYVSDRVGRHDQRRLLAAISDPDFPELRRVHDQLENMIDRAWTPDDPDWLREHRELLVRLRWWHRMFTATHLDTGGSAVFVELVESAPAVPGPRVDRVVQATGMRFSTVEREIGDQTEVFCPAPLLEEVVTHVIANIRQHGGDAVTPAVRVEYSLLEGRRMLLVIRNTATRASTHPGHGLRTLNDKLRSFGGSVSGTPLDGEWTFATEIGLSVWQGA